MAKRSAGLLMFRRTGAELQVLLVHPGGPFWAKKDVGVWSIPKGLVDDGEDELAAAQREVEEEIGTRTHGRFERLGEYRQRGGKVVIAWAVEAYIDIDPATIASNTFTLEWPPRSGQMKEFPEVDRAGWFSLPKQTARSWKVKNPFCRTSRSDGRGVDARPPISIIRSIRERGRWRAPIRARPCLPLRPSVDERPVG